MNNNLTSSQLNINDFETHPLWTWEDDDGRVIPLEVHEVISDEYDSVFVKCEIIMRDGTKVYGVASVRMSNHEVYLISFPEENGQLLDIPLQPLLSDLKALQLEKLRRQYNKDLDDIFPVNFITPFKFSDGALLKGDIDI